MVKNKAIPQNIFVSLGTHPQQFDRLLKELDGLIEKKELKGKVFAQTGHSTYRPQNFEWKDFLDINTFRRKVEDCDIFITHAGEGNIGLAKNMGKKFICVPRRKEFAEHTNDHQLELAQIVEEKKLGLVAWDVEELAKKMHEINSFSPSSVPRGRIVEILDKYVGELK